MCWRPAEISFSRVCPQCGAPQCNEQMYCSECGAFLEHFATIDEAGDLAVPGSEVKNERFFAETRSASNELSAKDMR